VRQKLLRDAFAVLAGVVWLLPLPLAYLVGIACYATGIAAISRGVPEVEVSCCVLVLVLVDQSTKDVAATQPTQVRRTPCSDGTGVAWAKLRCGRRWL
jgi:hypothetical protein